MTKKRCSKCSQEKPLDQFPWQNGKPKACCKACKYAIDKQARNEKRAADPEYAQKLIDQRHATAARQRAKPDFKERRWQAQRERVSAARAELALHPAVLKPCSVCQEPKQLTEFYPGQSRCKTCSKQEASRYITSRRQTDPLYRERANASNRQRYHEKRAGESNEARQLVSKQARERRLERKAKSEPATPRLCSDCGTDISDRYRNARVCATCKRARRQATVRNYVERRKAAGL